MKALVTGADGLLGSNLVRQLLHKNFEIKALIHPSSKSNTLEGLNIEKITGDILDISSVKNAAKGCNVVFHVAASTSMWPPQDPRITTINVEGTRNVLEASRYEGINKFIHTGSASSFGYGTKEKPGTEETPYRYGNLRLAYFDSKLKAQKMVLQYAKEGKIDAVVVNPTFMFGPYDAQPSSGKIIVKFVQLKPPFYPPGGRCFIHVNDVAEGMIAALEKGRTGECYILGNRNMEMKELLSILAKITGIREPKIKIPKQAMIFTGRLSSAIASKTKKTPELTYEIARISCVGSYYNAAKAIQELELPQTPIEKTLEDAYRWLKDNGKL